MPDLSTLWDALALVCGFALLGYGSDRLVAGAGTIALRTGVSPLYVGLTVVAMGTSLPEVVVGSLAAWRGDHAITIGTVLGSNVANIALILGVSGLLLPRCLDHRLSLRENGWLLGSLGLFGVLLLDGELGRGDGIALFLAFALYQLLLLRDPGEMAEPARDDAEVHLTRQPWLAVSLGSVAIGVGAEFVLRGGVGLAEAFGVSKAVISFTVLAVGTSLPELAASVMSARRGQSEIAVGNVIGSNIFNVLVVIGIAMGLHPSGPEHDALLHLVLVRDLPITALVTLFLVLAMAYRRGELGRIKASALVLLYGAYCLWTLGQG